MGEAAARRSRECCRGKCPPQISHSRDQPGGPASGPERAYAPEGSEEKSPCHGGTFAVILLIIELILLKFVQFKGMPCREKG
ncbi:MAG: hypothetical protein J7M32_13785 [Deltaproteobacteria bacterium]|nr:hypothetical protein [Deltaproteobacteria bacterium]